jgi:putative transposase
LLNPHGVLNCINIKCELFRSKESLTVVQINILMGHSLHRNYLHIVFSTKHRQPFIIPPFDNELYNYLGGICKNLQCNPVIVGGHIDHVHILCILSKKIPFVRFIGELKAHSSKWMKTKDKTLQNFYWQNGYGAFSVNPHEVEIVKSYISNQKEHHRKKVYQDEYRAILKKYQVEYDERYVWD